MFALNGGHASLCPPYGSYRHCKHAFTTSPRNAPEPLMNLPPLEGVGNAGCPLHPQPRVRFALVEMHTSKRVHRNHPAFPHAMVLTVSFVLLCPGSFATVVCGLSLV